MAIASVCWLSEILSTVTTFSKQMKFVAISQFDFIKQFVRLSFYNSQAARLLAAFETGENTFLCACMHACGSVYRPEDNVGVLVFVGVSHWPEAHQAGQTD